MNIICSYRNKSFAKKALKNNFINSFIIGLDQYNLFTEKAYSVEEIIDITNFFKKEGKKVIVDIAKIVHEDELQDLENKILVLSAHDVDYFMYSDFGVHYILNKNNLGSKTLLYSNTYLTNTFDTKIYQEKNSMIVLSNQINSDELIQISKDSFDNQIISAFGLALIMYTYRPLLTNYFAYRGKDFSTKKTNYSLQEEFREDLYPIIENENSTKIYDYGYYYLLNELKDVNQNIDIIVSGELLNDLTYLSVIDLYSAFIQNKLTEEEVLNKFSQLNINLNKGAYNKKLMLTKGGN